MYCTNSKGEAMTDAPDKAKRVRQSVTAALLVALLCLLAIAQEPIIVPRVPPRHILAPSPADWPLDGDTLKGLQLSFELIGDAFRKDELIKYRIKLTNVGKDPIAVYNRRWVAYGLQVVVMDTKGYRVPEDSFTEPSSYLYPLTKKDFSEKDFVTLAPEESYATTSSICLCDFIIKGPGDYLIAATYDDPVPPYLAPEGVKLWGQNYEKLHAKRVKFKVIE
jgi:hypothetical protein